MQWLKITVITLSIIFLNIGQLFAPNLSEHQIEEKEANKASKTRLNELLVAEFSPQNLQELLILLKTPNPEIAYRQARLESGNFTSRVFKEGNNLFGIHYPRIRDSYAFEYMIADGNRKVSKYRSWQSSCLDYVLLVKYYEDLGYNSDDYYAFLTEIHYCELGSRYIDILKSMS